MSPKMMNPAALAGANRAGKIVKEFDAPDRLDSRGCLSYPQALIARRYHLQPTVAAVICDLAGIGGRTR